MRLIQPNRALTDILLLLARVGLGAVFLAHGLQKLVSNGMAGTAEGFAAMGVPVPTLSAWVAALLETVGGAALILGLLTPVFSLLLAVEMIAAVLIVHLPNGIWVTENGYELVLALAAGALAVGALGAGRLSLDGVLAKRATGDRETVAAR
ncbi:DoxX family protein [Georgenia sp. AZ-5]|uniref:DoxX family protein n=1 Tax=Georgenia sp. AZ-5 TaxID=3367526 RepID=UPI0037550073